MAWVAVLGAAGALLFTLVLVPRWVLGPPTIARDPVDRVLIDVVRATALVIVVGELLVVLHLFQWLGLMLAGLGVFAWSRDRARRRALAESASDGARGALYLLEAASIEGNLRVKDGVRRWWYDVRHWRATWTVHDRGATVAVRAAAVIGVLGASLALRIAYPLHHESLVPAESYTHLAGMAHMALGRLFVDGVGPVGLRVVLATASTLTPVANVDLVRFAGPLLSTASVLVVYLLVRRATSNAGYALVPAAVVGVSGLGRGLGPRAVLQSGTVPEGLALLVALAGVAMVLEHVRSPSWARLRYIGMATLAVVLIHPPTALLLVVAGLVGGVALAGRHRSLVPIVQVVIPLAVGTGAAVLSFVVGRAVQGGPTLALLGGSSRRAPHVPPIVLVCLAAAGAALLISGPHLWRGRGERLLPGVLAATAIGWAVVALANSGRRFVGAVTEPASAYLLLPVGMGLVAAGVWRAGLVRSEAGRATIAGLVGVVLVAAMVVAFPPRFTRAGTARSEYDAAARVLEGSMRHTADLTFSVIGPSEWTDRVVGRAYRADIARFADRLTLEEAYDPGFVLPVASKRALLLDEKRPFGAGPGPAADASAPPDSGTIARSQVAHWMDVYATYHRGVHVIYEDKSVRVWQITSVGNPMLAERFKLANL